MKQLEYVYGNATRLSGQHHTAGEQPSGGAKELSSRDGVKPGHAFNVPQTTIAGGRPRGPRYARQWYRVVPPRESAGAHPWDISKRQSHRLPPWVYGCTERFRS